MSDEALIDRIKNEIRDDIDEHDILDYLWLDLGIALERARSLYDQALQEVESEG